MGITVGPHLMKSFVPADSVAKVKFNTNKVCAASFAQISHQGGRRTSDGPGGECTGKLGWKDSCRVVIWLEAKEFVEAMISLCYGLMKSRHNPRKPHGPILKTMSVKSGCEYGLMKEQAVGKAKNASFNQQQIHLRSCWTRGEK